MNSDPPPEPGLFSNFSIRKGSANPQIYNVSASSISIQGNVRSYSFNKQSLTLDVSASDYQLTATEVSANKWIAEGSNVITEQPFIVGGITYNIEKIEVNKEGNNVSVFLDKEVSNIRNIIFRVQVLGTQSDVITTYPLIRPSIENNKVLNVPSIGNDDDFRTIGDLVVSDTNADIPDKTIRLELFEIVNTELLKLPLQTYQYACFFKWNDNYGKEHISPFSNFLQTQVFGRPGELLEDGVTKVQINLKIKNINLTNKNNVSFVILRNDLTQGADALMKIVKEVDVDPKQEFIEITDDVPQDELYGEFLASAYSQLIQPPGAENIAIGRRNRIWLGNIAGYENAVIYSNSIANKSIDIFSFVAGIPFLFDHRIVALAILDQNLIVFTEREIKNITINDLRVNSIQASKSNFATQKQGIVEWKKGITYVNEKGIQYLGRDFNCYWISQKCTDLAQASDTIHSNPLGSKPIYRVISGYPSEREREVRFRLSDKDNNDKGFLVFNTEFEKWCTESIEGADDPQGGPEIEIQGTRFRISENAQNEKLLFESVISDMVSQIKGTRKFMIETGWLNFQGIYKSILMRNIDIIGDFGKYKSFLYRIHYDGCYNTELLWKSFTPYDDLQNAYKKRSLKRIAIIQQKIFNLKLEIIIVSDIVKLSALGFQFRKQVAGAHIGG